MSAVRRCNAARPPRHTKIGRSTDVTTGWQGRRDHRRQQRYRAGNRAEVCSRRRLRLHHRAPPERVGQGQSVDRRRRDHRCRRCHQKRGPRQAVRDRPRGKGRAGHPRRELGPGGARRAGQDHRGELRRHLRPQRPGNTFHRAEGAAVDARRRVGHSGRVGRGLHRAFRATPPTAPPRPHSVPTPARGPGSSTIAASGSTR